MLPEQIAKLIQDKLPNALVQVTSEDNHHFFATVIDDQFINVSLVNRQRQVYAALNEYIANGQLHAISFRVLTTEEADKA